MFKKCFSIKRRNRRDKKNNILPEKVIQGHFHVQERTFSFPYNCLKLNFVKISTEC